MSSRVPGDDIFAGVDEGVVDDAVEFGPDFAPGKIDALLRPLGDDGRLLRLERRDLAVQNGDLCFLGADDGQIGGRRLDARRRRLFLLFCGRQCGLRFLAHLLGHDVAFCQAVDAFEPAACILGDRLARAVGCLGGIDLRLPGRQLCGHLRADHVLLGPQLALLDLKAHDLRVERLQFQNAPARGLCWP